MRKIFLFLCGALALSAFASCNKNDKEVAQPDQKAERVTLSVGIKGNATKATVDGTAAENTVNSIQVFVFKLNEGSYVYEAYGTDTDASVDITVTTGTKQIVAIVNDATDYSAQTDRATILALANNFKDNGASSFRMAGTLVYKVTSSEHSASIPVNRTAARVRIQKITNALGTHKDESVKINRVYLTNVAAYNDYTNVKAATNFYATTSVNSTLDLDGAAVAVAAEKTAINGFTYSALDQAIGSTESYEYDTPVVLYAYPNDGATATTRVVVEMVVNSKYYTYPIELATMAANTTYDIAELKLVNLGNPSDGDEDINEGDENDPISSQSASFSVAVQPWTIAPIANGTGADEGKYVI